MSPERRPVPRAALAEDRAELPAPLAEDRAGPRDTLGEYRVGMFAALGRGCYKRFTVEWSVVSDFCLNVIILTTYHWPLTTDVAHLTARCLDQDCDGAMVFAAHPLGRRDLNSLLAPTCKPRQ